MVCAWWHALSCGVTFEEAMKFIIKWEGEGCYQVPGENFQTCYGIAQKWNSEYDFPLDYETAKAIYKKKYWDAARVEDLEGDWRLLVFDTAVNCGVGTATKLLRHARSPEHYLILRTRYYMELGEKWERYGTGWMNRMEDLASRLGIRKDVGDAVKDVDKVYVVLGKRQFSVPFKKIGYAVSDSFRKLFVKVW